MARPSPLARFRVAVLPDFFIDALAHVPPWPKARKQWGEVIGRGGGNLPVGPIEFKVGGNAANAAIALARLGAQVHLIATTDGLGRHLISAAQGGPTLVLDRLRVEQTASATLALESGGANLMLSHAGPLRDFSPRNLQAADWRVLEASDAVLATNWAQNRAGTALLSTVARRLGRRGIPLFIDTSDPRMAADRMDALLAAKQVWDGVESWALNENELKAFTGDRKAPLAELAKGLSSHLGCRLDLHTRAWALHVDGPNTTRVAAPKTKPRRLTGAGDAWNAGNVAGYLLKLDPAKRLRLAHMVASKYVSGASGRPPTYQEIPAAAWK